MNYLWKKNRKKYLLIVFLFLAIALNIFLIGFIPSLIYLLINNKGYIAPKDSSLVTKLIFTFGYLILIGGCILTSYLYYKKWKVNYSDSFKIFQKSDKNTKIINYSNYFILLLVILFGFYVYFIINYEKSISHNSFLIATPTLISFFVIVYIFYLSNYLNGWKKKLAKNNEN